jgi:hypothetical protein
MTTKLTVERWAKYLENEADGAVHYDDPHPYVWLELDDARAIASALRSVREAALAEGRERERALREALEAMVQTFGAQAATSGSFDPDDEEQAEVAALGDRIGFGSLMEFASRAWRFRLMEECEVEGAEFAAGTCVALAAAAVDKAKAALSRVPATEEVMDDG